MFVRLGVYMVAAYDDEVDGYRCGHSSGGFETAAVSDATWAVWEIGDFTLTAFLVLDVLVRGAMLRCKSWKVPMNYIGVVVFGISRLEIVLFHVTRAILAANPSLFQLLCIEKLARASRMVTMKSGMTSLHLLIRCLGASTNIFLTLVFCWIACFQCVSDMVASTFCRDFINKESQSLQVCVIEASAEIEAAEVEHFEALGIQASRAWSTCMEQLFARQQVSDAEAAVREEVRKVKCRLEKMRELAKAAAAGAEGAAERKVEASRICRTEASVERTLECSTHCAELAAPAERAVAQQVEAFAALCEQRAEEGSRGRGHGRESLDLRGGSGSWRRSGSSSKTRSTEPNDERSRLRAP
ncbi:Catsper1 [Symbiodinium sp. CCMP2592]|nr:Catsper1 [Symbiodinium sp. CCMP2592]